MCTKLILVSINDYSLELGFQMGLEHTEYKDEEVWAQILVQELAPQ